MCRKPDLTHLHLDEAERVVFLHEGLDAGAGILQTGLVLADPGDVFLNGRPVGVTVRVCAFPQSAGEGEDRRLHVLTQTVQDPLAVLHVLLQEEISEEGATKATTVSATPTCLVLPLLLLLLLVLFLSYAVLPLDPVQLLIQAALVKTQGPQCHLGFNHIMNNGLCVPLDLSWCFLRS